MRYSDDPQIEGQLIGDVLSTYLDRVDARRDLWPSINSRLQVEQRAGSSWQRLVTTWRLRWAAVGLALFMTLGAVGYAVGPTLGEKLFSQVMGRWGQDYKEELSHEINVSETIEGISVTVERAYFDNNRIGIEYTVNGLPASASEGTRRFEPQAELMDGRGPTSPRLGFPSAGGSGVRADSQIEGMEVPPDVVKEVVGFDVTEAQVDASGMQLRFVVSVAESVPDGNVLRHERMIGPFVFNFTVPFVPRKDIRVIQVGSTVEVAGVPVRLEEVTITPAALKALLRVSRSPEQARMGLKPGVVMLRVPGEWPSDKPLPWAYVVTTLGDIPDTFLARFHVHWEVEPGEWTLTVDNLEGTSDDGDEVVNGPWVFRFQVP